MSQIENDGSNKSNDRLSVSSKKVLEEDEYLGRMARIIKRDFFSDPTATPLLDCDSFTPATDRTDSTTSSVKSRRQACSLSLNKFLEKYTSEDNAYFEKLQQKDLKRHRSRFPWLYEGNRRRSKDTPALVSSNSRILSIEGPKRRQTRPQSTINYHSNRCLDHLFKEPAPVSNSSKIKTLGRFNDKFGIDGRPLKDSAIASTSEEAPPFFVSETPRPTVLDQRIKIETNKFYIPNESPRDELAHKVYQEKVARNIRTPKTSSHRDTSSRRTDKSLFNN